MEHADAGAERADHESLGSCSALFLPARGPTSSLTFGGAGGGGHVDVLAEPPFSGQWRVLSAPDWITFTHPATGVVGAGDGSAWYAVSPNPSTEPRVGTITFCNGSLEIRQSGRSLRQGRFVAGDFDDDGRADPAVFRPSEGRWYVLPSGQNYNHGASFSHQWGLPGDVPVPGDFDGDKKTDLAVYRATGFAGFTTSGAWFLRYSSDAYGYGTPTAYPWSSAPYHAPENRALLADFSGDGKSDFVVYRPSTGRWHIQFTSLAAFADMDVGLLDAQWGLDGDIPVRPTTTATAGPILRSGGRSRANGTCDSRQRTTPPPRCISGACQATCRRSPTSTATAAPI